jgi:hypothetical protein
MVVPVDQVDRAIGDDPVEGGLVGHPAREDLHGPAAADDPLGVRMGCGVPGDAAQVLVQVGGAGQVALAQFDTPHHGVDVRVLEAGEEEPAAQVDHLGSRAGQVADLVPTHCQDPATTHGEGGRGRVADDWTAEEQQVSVHIWGSDPGGVPARFSAPGPAGVNLAGGRFGAPATAL